MLVSSTRKTTSSCTTSSTTPTKRPCPKNSTPVKTPVVNNVNLCNHIQQATQQITLERAVRLTFDAAKQRWSREEVEVWIDPNVFGRGSLRVAHKAVMRLLKKPDNHGNTEERENVNSNPKKEEESTSSSSNPSSSSSQQNTAPNPLVTCVAKFIDPCKAARSKIGDDVKRQWYLDDVETQNTAIHYANLFNQAEPPKKIKVVDCWLLELIGRQEQPFCLMEPYLEGKFCKYNDNWGGSYSDRQTPQAFSHFTYDRSNQRLLICDVQGVDDVYTDPQIHTLNGKGFGVGNKGEDGMKRFLASHSCNNVCRILGLPDIAMDPRVRGIWAATAAQLDALSREQTPRQYTPTGGSSLSSLSSCLLLDAKNSSSSSSSSSSLSSLSAYANVIPSRVNPKGTTSSSSAKNDEVNALENKFASLFSALKDMDSALNAVESDFDKAMKTMSSPPELQSRKTTTTTTTTTPTSSSSTISSMPTRTTPSSAFPRSTSSTITSSALLSSFSSKSPTSSSNNQNDDIYKKAFEPASVWKQQSPTVPPQQQQQQLKGVSPAAPLTSRPSSRMYSYQSPPVPAQPSSALTLSYNSNHRMLHQQPQSFQPHSSSSRRRSLGMVA